MNSVNKARLALVLCLVGLVGGAGLAGAADAPRTTTTSKTLFLSQNGCGTTAEPGRLETTVQVDSADGCGTIGGLPLNEAAYQVGGTGDDYSTTSKLVPFAVDATRKVTGQLAAGSWVGSGSGGAGSVQFEVQLVGTTTAGKSVDFGAASVSGTATPGKDVVEVPFSLTVPASAAGATLRSLTLTVDAHGANVGMSAKKLNGSSYVVVPSKAATTRKK